MAVETREDKIRHNGRENIDGVLQGVTSTAALIDLYPYPAEERTTRKCHAQRIRRGIEEAVTVS